MMLHLQGATLQKQTIINQKIKWPENLNNYSCWRGCESSKAILGVDNKNRVLYGSQYNIGFVQNIFL